MRDYDVTATDISSKSIERAKREAEAFGVSIRFGAANFRTLERNVPGTFQVVLSTDNAIPHLLTDEDLHRACRNLHAKLKDGGLLVITIRDYDELVAEKQRATPPRVMDEGKRIVFQKWDWSGDGKTYVAHQFILRENDGNWTVQENSTPYRALLRAELSSMLEAAGFRDIKWLMPDESGYYQPVVTARR